MPTSSDLGLDARQLARLAVQARLTSGAAHSLNNAFTAALGETSYLLDVRKEDEEVIESGQIVLESLERSMQISRSLVHRRCTLTGGSETDLGHLMREVVGLMSETLGSGHPLRAKWDEDWIGIAAEPADIDLLITSLLQFAADTSGQQAALSMSLERSDADARIEVAVSSHSPVAGIADSLNDPSVIEDAISRLCVTTAHEITRSLGGSLHAETTGPDSWTFVLRLPAID